MPFEYPVDMWSVGCTLFELWTGKILFTGRSNNQMLRSIMECRGKFSLKMLKKGQCAADHFNDKLDFRSVEKDKFGKVRFPVSFLLFSPSFLQHTYISCIHLRHRNLLPFLKRYISSL